MEWLETLTGETRGRLLRLVRGSARSVSELAAALEISENAVRAHVASLERDGLVRQGGVERSTGGKPARLYELTAAAEELFPKAYSVAFSELVQTLREEEGEVAAVARLRRVGRRLGARAAAAAGAPAAERVAAAAAFLESLGGSVEVVDEPHGWTLRANGCPLSAVVATDPDVCVVAEALVSAITGLPVVEMCQKTGRPRCAFRVDASLEASRAPASRPG